jgi:TPR repeat protein
VAEQTGNISEWTPVERAYSLWLRAARESQGSQSGLARAMLTHLRKVHGLKPDADLSELGVKKKIDGSAIGRWEKGTGGKKPQPQYPDEEAVRETLIAVVTKLVPVVPAEMEWASFRDVCEAFASERLARQYHGAGVLDSLAARERNEERHQFLAAWPSPASLIDPIVLGLGSWAFNGSLPRYANRTADKDLVLRLKEPGITTVSGAPKSGKSRSILEVLQRHYPKALTWWVNPAPGVLPLVVENAKKAPAKEKPAFVILDDAGMVGLGPADGLTAQRLVNLSAASTHLVVVVHDETLAGWEHQLTNRAPENFDAQSLGATKELLNLLQHRIRYDSVLDDDETVPAAEIYEVADNRIKSFDLTRLAETLAGVEMLRDKALKLVETPTSVEAALLEAGIDASIAFPTGVAPDVLAALAKTHYRRRQPNRPWRGHLFEGAFDSLTTGITTGSPHSILITTDHQSYRLLDALVPELQHPDRNVLDILRISDLPDLPLDTALVNTGAWHCYSNRQYEKAKKAWKAAADRGNGTAMVRLGYLAASTQERGAMRAWWKLAAETADEDGMYLYGGLLEIGGHLEEAQTWFDRAAEKEHPKAMCKLGDRAAAESDPETAKTWWTRAADNGSATAMFRLGVVAEKAGDMDAARNWWEHAAEKGEEKAMFRLGVVAETAGDMDAARNWWETAAFSGEVGAMCRLGWHAQEDGDTETAKFWWEWAAGQGSGQAMFGLAMLAARARDMVAARIWTERAATKGAIAAMEEMVRFSEKEHDLAKAETWRRRVTEAYERKLE